MDAINTEVLITLVEEKPVIWDKTLEIYRDKNLKALAWREICAALNEDLEDMEQWQKEDFGKLVLRKWTQIRDTWMKCYKKQKKDNTSGAFIKPSRLYIYHKQMSFLKKITDPPPVQENTKEIKIEISNDNATESEEVKIPNRNPNRNPRYTMPIKNTASIRKRNAIDKVDAKIMSFIDYQMSLIQKDNAESPHLYFFKSLIPSMCSFDNDQTLEFQSGVINLLQKIKRQNEATNHNRPLENFKIRLPKPQTQTSGSPSNASQSPTTSRESNDSKDPDYHESDFY